MKHETAIDLALTEAPGLARADVDKVIRRYIAELNRCGACEGTGTVIAPSASIREPSTSIECPRCTPRKHAGRDPDHLAWVCDRGATYESCDPGNPLDNGMHETCGWTLVLLRPEPPVAAEAAS